MMSEANKQLLDLLRGLVDDIQGLIAESDGVAGLHLNGDVAPWGELEAGGQFERLSHLQAAIKAAQCSEQCAELPGHDARDSVIGGIHLDMMNAGLRSDQAMANELERVLRHHLPESVFASNTGKSESQHGLNRTSEAKKAAPVADSCRAAFDAQFDYMVDAVDDVDREWLWRFTQGVLGRLPEPVNQRMLAALQRIGGMTMSMYVSAGEAMSDAKRLANEAIAAAEQADHIGDAAEMVQAEPVALPFFAYDSEVGFERFATDAEAKRFVQQGINEYRSLAGDGWPEEVDNLCWGVVLGTTREVALPDNYDGAFGLADAAQLVDYVLTGTAQPPAVAVPDGYALVPVEPTRAMLDAAKFDLVRDGEIDPMLKGIYRALLAAAKKGGAND